MCRVRDSIIGAAIEVHKNLGPGLLESTYEECLSHELSLRNFRFERQKPIPVVYKQTKLECGYRIDLLVESKVVVKIRVADSVDIQDAGDSWRSIGRHV